MFGLGIWELLIILFIILVFMGGGRLPELGRQLGRTFNEVRSITGGQKEETEGDQTEQPKSTSENLVSGLKELNQLRSPGGKFNLLKRLSKKL